MPRKPFKVIQSEIKEGKITGKSVTKEIKEITIVRSHDGYDSIIGWNF